MWTSCGPYGARLLRNIWQNAQNWLVARGRTIKAEALSKCIRRYPQRRRAAAPQRASGAQNRATRRVLKLTRQTEDLVRLMRNIGLGCAPWQAVHLWTKIRMAGRAVLKSSNWFRYWQRHTLPPLSALQRLAQDLRAEAASRHEQERAERMESWKRWLRADFKACCDFCKGDCTERVTMVQREDGTHTANAAQVHQLLQDAWLPVVRMYDKVVPPSWTESALSFGELIPPRTSSAWRIRRKDIESAILHSGSSVSGPDGIPFKAWRALGPLGVSILYESSHRVPC